MNGFAPAAASSKPSAGSKTMRSPFVSVLMRKTFGEGSPKVFPHRRGDRLTLAERLFGEGQFEIRERALLSTEARRDEAPEVSGEP